MALKKIDHSALKTNQAVIITLAIGAFVFNQAWLVLFTGLVMAFGTLIGRPGFGFLYKSILRPLGWVRPDVLDDNPEPHRFAQGFGAVVMLLAFGSLSAGAAGLGWGLAWLVAALAALNLFGGFCVGCAIYYWLGRLRVPLFDRQPPPETVPGFRPPKAG